MRLRWILPVLCLTLILIICSESFASKINLTETEQSWIARHNVVRMHTPYGFPPVAFYENNEWKGMFRDYAQLVSERTGVRFEFVNFPFSQQEEKAKSREVDILHSYDIPERKKYMNFTRPFFTTNWVIVSRSDSAFIGGVESLKDKKVAIIKGVRGYDYVVKKYPEISLLNVDSIPEAMEAVSSGKVDAAIGPMTNITYTIYQKRMNNLKISGMTDYPQDPLMYAVRNDWPELQGIIDKALVSISEEEHKAILHKWVPLHLDYVPGWREIIEKMYVFIILIGLVILGLIVYWNRRLVREINARRKAQEALRDSEERYRLVSDFTYEWEFWLGTKGEVHYNSPSCERISGYPADVFIADPDLFHIIIHPEDKELWLGHLATEKNAEITFRIFTKKGEERIIEHICQPVYDADGSYLGRRASNRDITDRKKAEEALRKSEENYRTLVENASDMVYRTDENGYFTFGNPAGLRITGYKEEEIIGKHYKMLVRPDVFKKTITFFANQLINKTKNTYYEYPIITKDGRELWFGQNMQLIMEEDKVTGFQAVARDITDRKLAEDKLKDSENRFRQLANSTWEGIFIHRDGIVLDVNQALTDMFGYDKTEIIGKNVLDFIAPEFIEKAMRLMKKSVGESVLRFEGQGRKKDGTLFPMETLGKLITYYDLPARVIAIRDLTQQKQLEEAREKLEAQKRQIQKSESLDRMAGAIAHHFNNQLGVVIGNLELAMTELTRGSKPNDYLTSAMAASNKAAEMSGMMLTYLGQSSDKRELLDISEVCLRNQPILCAVMPENVVMETDITTPGPIISANENQIQQVLTNLVTNAWESIVDNKGTIYLNVKTVNPAEISAVHRYPSDWQPKDKVYACLEVKDTGCGIEDKDIEKFFDPFFSTKFTGRGMGLAVVLGIVKAHGGVIMVASKLGSGSTFRVFFPVSEEAPKQPQKVVSKDDSLISVVSPIKFEEGGTVLLIEDEELLRNMATTMLKRLGFTVLEANDGVEAVDVFRQRQNEINFVISDLTMPRMDGWETLTALRKLKPGIPVILASGYDQAHVMAGDHPELPQVFLGKPYRVKGLSDAISQIFG